MFDPDLPDLPNAGGHRLNAAFSVDALNEIELLRLRQEIDNRLPAKSLRDVDLAHELVVQLQVVKQLQNEVIGDDDTPANQRAQVAGQVASVITSLAKMQNETFDSERLKKVEGVLIQVLQGLPEDVQERFLVEYEAALGTLE